MMKYFITANIQIAKKLSRNYILISEVLKDFLENYDTKDLKKLDEIYGKVYLYEDREISTFTDKIKQYENALTAISYFANKDDVNGEAGNIAKEVLKEQDVHELSCLIYICTCDKKVVKK